MSSFCKPYTEKEDRNNTDDKSFSQADIVALSSGMC